MISENQHKNELNLYKIELSRRDKESSSKLRKLDDFSSKPSPVRGNPANNFFEFERDPYVFERKKTEKPERDLKEIKGEIEKFEKKIVRDTEKLNTLRTNPEEIGDSRVFIDKFKKVIDKLENRLEKMSSDMKRPNNSFEFLDK